MTNKEWFKQAKFGMFIHWGLYSVLGGEGIHSEPYAGLGEWIGSNLNIPIAEYEQLTKAFNPIFFDAEEWVMLAKEAGIQVKKRLLPVTLVGDGYLYRDNLPLAGKDEGWVRKVLRERNAELSDTWLLTVDASDRICFVRKEAQG